MCTFNQHESFDGHALNTTARKEFGVSAATVLMSEGLSAIRLIYRPW